MGPGFVASTRCRALLRVWAIASDQALARQFRKVPFRSEQRSHLCRERHAALQANTAKACILVCSTSDPMPQPVWHCFVGEQLAYLCH